MQPPLLRELFSCKRRVEEEWKSKADFIKIPTVANDTKFIYNE